MLDYGVTDIIGVIVFGCPAWLSVYILCEDDLEWLFGLRLLR